MFGIVKTLVSDRKARDLACVAGSAVALLAGRKLTAAALMTKGMIGLERHYRERTGFEGTWDERMARSAEFYEGTHQDPTNRILHRVGIPVILGGTVGLFLFPAYRPMWLASWGAFTVGWTLNFIGHGVYEKNAPAFADDPLSFVAGPLWDLKQLRGGALDADVLTAEPVAATREPVAAA